MRRLEDGGAGRQERAPGPGGFRFPPPAGDSSAEASREGWRMAAQAARRGPRDPAGSTPLSLRETRPPKLHAKAGGWPGTRPGEGLSYSSPAAPSHVSSLSSYFGSSKAQPFFSNRRHSHTFAHFRNTP